MTQDEKIAELRDLEAKATPGPWEAHRTHVSVHGRPLKAEFVTIDSCLATFLRNHALAIIEELQKRPEPACNVCRASAWVATKKGKTCNMCWLHDQCAKSESALQECESKSGITGGVYSELYSLREHVDELQAENEKLRKQAVCDHTIHYHTDTEGQCVECEVEVKRD